MFPIFTSQASTGQAPKRPADSGTSAAPVIPVVKKAMDKTPVFSIFTSQASTRQAPKRKHVLVDVQTPSKQAKCSYA
jgi:hypothetical protein